MKDKVPWRWSRSILRYITERGINVFDWPGNSADLTSIQEVWNIMKKKSGKLSNNKKPEDQWSCKRSPDIWASYKHKIYKTWKTQDQEMTLTVTFNTHFHLLN